MRLRLRRLWQAVTLGLAEGGTKERQQLASSSPQETTSQQSTASPDDAAQRYLVQRDRRYVERVLRSLDEENALLLIEKETKESP